MALFCAAPWPYFAPPFTHPLAKRLIRLGLTNLHNTDPGKDAFQVLEDSGMSWFLGTSPAGVLQAVHALTCGTPPIAIADGAGPTGAFAFTHRIFSPILGGGLFDPASPPDAVGSCVRYVSRMGASHVAVTHDFSGGSTRDMHAYVESAVFPAAADARRRPFLRQRLRDILDAAADHGLEALFDARLMPCQGGPWVPERERQAFLERFPSEVLSDSGTYQGKVLCFGHPATQRFLAEVATAFLHDFPEIGLFHVLTMDAEGEFCDPDSCPRCRGIGKFDQRDRLARFLERTMTAARPGIRILNTGFQWDRDRHGIGQLLARQSTLPEAVGLCLSATGDAATFDRQRHDHLQRARSVTHRGGQLAIGRDAMHAFEDSLHEGRQRFDYPGGIVAKIARWQDLGFDGFIDVRGRLSPLHLHANSLACRAALLNPRMDASAFLRSLAGRWFGEAAGPLVGDAWTLLERAQAIRSIGYSFPSSSRLPEYVPWHFNRDYLPLASNPSFFPPPTGRPGHGELSPAAATGITYHDGDLPTRLRTTGECLLDAAHLFAEVESRLRRALTLPLPERIPDAGSWIADEGAASPAAYLEEHLAFVANSQRFAAVMGPYFVLTALSFTHAQSAEAYGRDATEWLPRFAQAARALADHLEGWRKAGGIGIEYPERFSPETLRSQAGKVEGWLSASAPR